MKLWFFLLLAVSASVACGQTGSEGNVTDNPPKSPASVTDSDSDGARQDGPETAEKSDKVVRTEKEWKKLLSREQFEVLRMKGTERPFRNKYDRHFEPGSYACAACGQELFTSETKFNSGCGWPAFYAAKAGERVKLATDRSHGMVRTEVICARCDSHLGHIFDDAPQTPTGQRYCINSVSLKFIPAGSKDKSEDKKTNVEKKRAKEDERQPPDK